MTTTEIASLALTHIGEPSLTDLDTDTTVAAITARQHYSLTLRSLLEEHPWSFARKRKRLAPDSINLNVIFDIGDGYAGTFLLTLTTSTEKLTEYTYTEGTNTLKLYRYDDISDLPVDPDNPTVGIVYLDTFISGTKVDASSAYSSTVQSSSSLPHLAELDNYGASYTTAPTFTLPTDVYPWTVGHTLPTDCLRYLRVALSTDIPLKRFEILDRRILTHTEDFLNLFYITDSPTAASYPAAFTRALALLLAANIAPQITRDEALANTLLQKYQITLADAIRRDTRETQSGENSTPAKLARNSGLWQSRFRSHGAPGLP